MMVIMGRAEEAGLSTFALPLPAQDRHLKLREQLDRRLTVAPAEGDHCALLHGLTPGPFAVPGRWCSGGAWIRAKRPSRASGSRPDDRRA